MCECVCVCVCVCVRARACACVCVRVRVCVIDDLRPAPPLHPVDRNSSLPTETPPLPRPGFCPVPAVSLAKYICLLLSMLLVSCHPPPPPQPPPTTPTPSPSPLQAFVTAATRTLLLTYLLSVQSFPRSKCDSLQSSDAGILIWMC